MAEVPDELLQEDRGRLGGALSRARCEERFGVDAMVRAYEAVWRSVAERYGGR